MQGLRHSFDAKKPLMVIEAATSGRKPILFFFIYVAAMQRRAC